MAKDDVDILTLLSYNYPGLKLPLMWYSVMKLEKMQI